ncbi:GerMN domain-containing protein [Trichocoleus sp. FACHB-90]|uniref:GerMN domain-containing protein n=1 Tax=Cyanophyceae TaxID=3028117 RepID=UPI001682A019|nr:GerMN domain-containing protein [Trichocoleus sp. FACHB-90]MBD1927224.1 GerMN domain-containing protein [Trichocoleus sp. FACHB-90]
MRQPTLLNFCLFVAFVGISGWGSQTINAMSSQRLSPAESLTNATISQQTNLTKQATPAVSAQAPAAVKKVKVFFPKNPQSGQDFTYVEPVLRTTSSASVAQFAIEQLIAGPTSQEKARGLVAPIQLRGNSNCGSNFSLSINNGVAKMRFCKQVVVAGVGDTARQQSSITTTLKQFSSVRTVILLDKNGNCLNDQSGNNLCLRNQA